MSILELGFFSGEEHPIINIDKKAVNKFFICKILMIYNLRFFIKKNDSILFLS